ncbi:MAG: DUF87 domain-containing protein [Anaerolineae bacterium]|nr:DUF87 domain-containing protein [Anaerolineae bacterium]
METDGRFYLGRLVDKEAGAPYLYPPDDLTTHALVVGMTGSVKTGLCLNLLEEAALQRIPALMIDPKGDITNALLHFPNLAGEDFQPWVNPVEVRRQGRTVEELMDRGGGTGYGRAHHPLQKRYCRHPLWCGLGAGNR